mgnify:FL=1
MRNNRTLVITGIGGQGIVYLVNLLCEAALAARIQVGASEIHGLSQRGGSVNACMVFGQSASTLLGPGEADYMIGLEPLEAQRNQGFLHRDSRAVIDTHPVYPFSVNSGSARYPDTSSFIELLRTQIAQVLHIDSVLKLPVTLRSLYVLGQASTLDDFPVSAHFLGEAITRSARPERRADHLDAFKHGCDQGTTIPANAELARPPTEH